MGLSEGYVRSLARTGRKLADLPVVERAMRDGVIGLSKVRQLVRVAPPGDEAGQRAWVERARRLTVRRLEQEVRAIGAGSGEPPVEQTELFFLGFDVPARLEGKWHFVLELARRVVGSDLSSGHALEYVLMEFVSGMLERLGGETVGALLEADDELVKRKLERRALRKRLLETTLPAICERASNDWELLDHMTPEVGLPDWAEATPTDAFETDALIQKLVAVRRRVDWQLGQLGLTFSMLGLHRELRFASTEHYARERLDMSGRTFRKRVALARQCTELPHLGAAVREGRLGTTAAEWVARVATRGTDEAWVQRAESMTLRALEAEARQVFEGGPRRRGDPPPQGPYLVGEDERPMCAKDEDVPIRCWVQAEGLRLWHIALRLGGVEEILDHFIEMYGETNEAPSFVHIYERDGWRCTAPGCRNRRNLSVHHVRFRSKGGDNEDENLTVLCAFHHLDGVHGGKIRCKGKAPERLLWEFPLTRYLGDRKLSEGASAP